LLFTVQYTANQASGSMTTTVRSTGAVVLGDGEFNECISLGHFTVNGTGQRGHGHRLVTIPPGTTVFTVGGFTTAPAAQNVNNHRITAVPVPAIWMNDGSGSPPVQPTRTITVVGTNSIVPSAANTPTSLAITFPPGSFPADQGNPTIMVTPNTTVPGTTTGVNGWAATSPTPTGFLLWVNRGNTTSTSLFWTATLIVPNV
jgi:hypothetical protein